MIITLCGSNRFEELFKKWNIALTYAGHTVFTLTAYASDMGGKVWYSDEEKKLLDDASAALPTQDETARKIK